MRNSECGFRNAEPEKDFTAEIAEDAEKLKMEN